MKEAPLPAHHRQREEPIVKRTIILVVVLALVIMVLGVGLVMAKDHKVDICHATMELDGGAAGHVISVSAKAVDKHLAHGDSLVWVDVDWPRNVDCAFRT